MNPTIVILAAGLGTRMKSGLAKALHPLAGLPLIKHVLNAALGSLEPEKIILVLGHQADQVTNALGDSRVVIVIQAEQLGTGHAVQQAADSILAGYRGRGYDLVRRYTAFDESNAQRRHGSP